ncbi:MarR family winged helix-turn-helix transcriptional regulator [Streptomyces shenzhenensis]|uniref:MarR family winged helix-turn-helix transcriptional regulator n=1 Tax=Streptomyces shenzhenensis TaxID=943815 RepID=UPI00368304B0
MHYSHPGTELVQQPAGYWTWAAAHAILGNIHAALATVGLTQPQWWVLNQLADPDGTRTRRELTSLLHGYQNPGDRPIGEAVDILLALGFATETDSGTLGLTPAGRRHFERAGKVMDQLREQRHAGIPDEQYVQTLKVLQRFTHNTGGHAWHH